MKNIAIFASGSGSNFQAIVDAIEVGKLHANLKLLVCDKPGAIVVERAKKADVPVYSFMAKQFASKKEFEEAIYEQLKRYNVDFIVLAGYMRLIGPFLLEKYPGRIINIHPSLLPAFPGKDAIGQAVSAGVKITGVTIHFVDEGMDTGPIIAQRAVEIADGETEKEVAEKIHAVEHVFYPETLEGLLN